MKRPKNLQVNSRIAIPFAELQFTFVRSSGPGGQNVNKVNSKAVLRWDVSGTISLPPTIKHRFRTKNQSRINDEGCLVMSSQRYRDQGRNVDDCLTRLKQLVLEATVVPTPRKATRKPRRANERRLKNKSDRSQKKELRRPPRMD